MILGPPGDVGLFLKHNWRKQPVVVQIKLERILALLKFFEGKYGDQSGMLEIKNAQRDSVEIDAFLKGLQDELVTPMLGGEASVLVLPKGYEQPGAPLDAETFFLLVRGTGVKVAGFDAALGGLMYFPRESPVRLKCSDDCVLLRLRLHPTPAYRFVFDQLVARLVPQGGWSEPLSGLLGFGEPHEQASQQLDRLLGALREEVEGLDARGLLEGRGGHSHSKGP